MSRADQRKYHYIYKTTCTVSGNWYIGRHSTDDLNDGYIGSGTRLWHSINKHGRENHTCEILEFLPNRKSLILREAELVNSETLNDSMCMNLTEGGEGYTLEACKAGGSRGGKIAGKITGAKNLRVLTKKLRENKEYHAEFCDKIKQGLVIRREVVGHNWLGLSHKEETKAKIRATIAERGCGKGEKNSNFGKRNKCMSKDGITKRVPLKDVEQFLSEGWQFGFAKKKMTKPAGTLSKIVLFLWRV